jgi:hypothetical protein
MKIMMNYFPASVTMTCRSVQKKISNRKNRRRCKNPLRSNKQKKLYYFLSLFNFLKTKRRRIKPKIYIRKKHFNCLKKTFFYNGIHFCTACLVLAYIFFYYYFFLLVLFFPFIKKSSTSTCSLEIFFLLAIS